VIFITEEGPQHAAALLLLPAEIFVAVQVSDLPLPAGRHNKSNMLILQADPFKLICLNHAADNYLAGLCFALNK
jgi:hypothetical protein